MSFYRSILAAVAAIAIASPVFAEDAAAPQATASTEATQVAPSADASAASAEQSATASESKVNINKATAKELMAIKGITSSRANAIVKFRKQHGDFKSTDDLANVRGFKKMKSDKMKEITDRLTIE